MILRMVSPLARKKKNAGAPWLMNTRGEEEKCRGEREKKRNAREKERNEGFV